MTKYTKEQLIEKGQHFFDNPKVKKMFATEDGNFFYPENPSYCFSHAKDKKNKWFEIFKKVEKTEVKEPKATDIMTVAQLKNYAKENNIEFEKGLNKQELIDKINS